MEEKSDKKSGLKGLASNPKLVLVKSFMQDLIDGNILVRKSFRKQYLLIFIIACMCIVYIGNRYKCDSMLRQQRELIKEIEDKRYELLSISAELTQKSRGSVIEDSIKSQLPELQVARVQTIIIEQEKE